MSPHDRDRKAILQRRALFVGSTLAALGSCARTTQPAEHATAPIVVVPGDAPDAGRAELVDGALPPRKESPTRLGDMPPLDPPEGVSDDVRERYERLARIMTDAHRAIDDISLTIPKCEIGACEADWRVLAGKVFDLDGLFRFFYVCPGSSPEAKAYAERDEAHRKHYAERRSVMDRSIAEAVGTSAKRWEELLDEHRQAHPVPCLSFACRDW